MNTKYIAGFAALNSGSIHDCYSTVCMKVMQPLAGFCFENTGSIRNCMFHGKLKNGTNPKSGLCYQQKGNMTHCFFILSRNKETKDNYTDQQFGFLASDLKQDKMPEPISHWDMAETWSYNNGVFELFSSQTDSLPKYEQVVEIGSREDLEQLVYDVNAGRALRSTLYRLTRDIDLGGKDWTPIGCDPYMPFQSLFDGAGHIIRNFRINAKKHPYAGLFGCASRSSKILNLTVDCILTGSGNCAGPICAQNHGHIHNCIAQAQTSICRYTGGLVGQNMGTISNSCALGGILVPFLIPWWLPILCLLLLTVTTSTTFILNANNAPPQEVFAPVILDPNATPIEKDPFKPNEEEITDSNATFIMNAEMSVSTENYAGAIGLRCPSWSNRGFVATVRVSGADLRAHVISISEEYYPIYKSGLITPGFGVEVITLGALPGGVRLPAGVYELSVLFDFYNIETHEKSSVDSIVPLEVTIH